MNRTERVSRRAVLGGVAALTGGFAGCNALADVFPEAGEGRGGPQVTDGPVSGRVRDADGDPIPDATVSALGRGGTQLARTTTDTDGTFTLPTQRPVWVRATAEGYTERVVAGTPTRRTTVVLMPAAGTATIAFGGDVMFGRRFTRPSSDDLNPRHYIRREHRRADLEHVLSYVSPLVSATDIASVNLESPLTTTAARHPEKTHTFVSAPVAAEVLADAGIDYAALGNNHAFDALDGGLEDTTDALDSAGVSHSGAGQSPAGAWEPAVVERSGLDIALVSCTTLVGDQYDLHWSADRTRDRPISVATDAGTRTVPPGAGVAEASPERLRERVRTASDDADVVAVQIHGGEQYRPTPTARMRDLTQVAVEAGADLVVNHHPHVVGGIERRDGAVVAWSLGNLVFDQKLWPTFPSYLLRASVTADGVARVVADPLLLEGFVPKGVVGKPNRFVTSGTAGRSDSAVRITDSGLALGVGTAPPETTTTTLAGDGTLYARRRGWVREVRAGQARLGRDLLPTGTFESVDVDETGHDGALWRYSRSPPAVAPSFGVDGSGGVRLHRIADNAANVIVSNSRRIPVSGPLTLTFRYRTGAATGLSVELAWYAGTDGSAITRRPSALDSTGGQWTLLQRDIDPPEGATHLNVVVALQPPNGGRRTAHLDDVRLISWADPGVTGGREYDHLRVESDATVGGAVPARADGFDWRPLE
jgi:poly-gamma-glutamate capsule biosynthesis protein CapA/YwtB (metallophosphatase superfamily)